MPRPPRTPRQPRPPRNAKKTSPRWLWWCYEPIEECHVYPPPNARPFHPDYDPNAQPSGNPDCLWVKIDGPEECVGSSCNGPFAPILRTITRALFQAGTGLEAREELRRERRARRRRRIRITAATLEERAGVLVVPAGAPPRTQGVLWGPAPGWVHFPGGNRCYPAGFDPNYGKSPGPWVRLGRC